MTNDRQQHQEFAGDILGIVIALVCLIHCIALSLLAIFLPWLLSRLGLGTELHQMLAFLALFIGLATLLPGYHQHRKIRVLALGGIGLVLLVAGALVPQDLCCFLWTNSADSPLIDRLTPLTITVSLMTPIGCCLLAAAHLINRRQCQRCRRDVIRFFN